MAHRKNQKKDLNIIEQHMNQPWQVSMLVAVVLFVFARWLVPMMSHSAVYKPVLGLVSIFGQILALPFILISAAIFLNGLHHARTTERVWQPQRESGPGSERKSNSPAVAAHGQSSPVVKQPAWSHELLKQLEWKRFELLCAEYFRVLGKVPKVLAKGADGGIDVRVFSAKTNTLEIAIQCKAWSSPVGVKEVRELFGVMAHELAPKGIFMATSTFTNDALVFARKNRQRLFLVDGTKFISMIKALPEAKQSQLLAFATEGDYTTPTCASCGIKMVWREKGAFWGCRNYPRCKSTLRTGNPATADRIG